MLSRVSKVTLAVVSQKNLIDVFSTDGSVSTGITFQRINRRRESGGIYLYFVPE